MKRLNINPPRWTSRWVTLFSCLLLAGIITACSGEAAEETTVSPDNAGSESAAVQDAAQDAESASEDIESASKIVALTSLTADVIHTLDEDKLVGISGSSILTDDERFNGLEVVSQGRTEPDLEKIVALKPDLVIGAPGFHEKTLTRLDELNIKTLSIDVRNWDTLKETTVDLAQRIGADPQPLLERYDACLAKAAQTEPEALVLVSRQPLLSPNKNSWAGDFLAQFNIKNLTAELQGQSPFDGYITLSEEKVLSTNPDMLLVVETRDDLLGQLKGDAFWGKLDATKNEQVHTFGYFGLINPGSIASIEAACQQLSEL